MTDQSPERDMPLPAETRDKPSSTAHEPPRLTFIAGGYVIVLTVFFAAALMAWALWPVFTRDRPPGDGVNPETYLYDLDHSTVPRDDIVPVMIHRGMVPVMEKAVVLDGRSLAPEVVADQRKKLLVSSDRVIGVTIGGESRAYPINVLNVHEIINDTLGGVPIAVTYHWPSDAAMAFDRRIGGRTVVFDVSGLLYNGNMLLFPRNEPVSAPEGSDEQTVVPIGGESLYSQLLARAVTGADAETGITLNIVPAQLTSWGDWIAAYPDTTVAGRDPDLVARRYEHGDPGEYLMNDQVKFPPQRMPPADSWAPKTQVVAVQIGDARRVYPLPHIWRAMNESGVYEDTLNGESLRFQYDHASHTAEVTTSDGRIPTKYHAYWFAWYAMHPKDEVVWE